VASADPGKGTGEVAFAGHRHGRASHAGDEGQQSAERGCGGTCLDHGCPGGQPGLFHGVEQRRRRGGKYLHRKMRQEQDTQQQVDDQSGRQGAEDGARNDAFRVLDLLAERGDAGVPGKGEEHQACGGQNAPAVAGLSGDSAGSCPAVGNMRSQMLAAATNASVARTMASRMRVRKAVRVMPSRFTPVSAATAAMATGVA
jgi:hypothetical protein